MPSGCGQQKAAGAAFCALHKRVMQNVTNDTKVQTGGKGDQWAEFNKDCIGSLNLLCTIVSLTNHPPTTHYHTSSCDVHPPPLIRAAVARTSGFTATDRMAYGC
jgi:hypothetical protein